MRRIRLSTIVAAILLAGGVAAGFLFWRPGRDLSPGAGTAPGGWEVRAGAIEPVADEAGGGDSAPRRFRAAEEARLERGRQSLVLSPGSIVEFAAAPGAPSPGASTAALPAVVEGSASFTSDRPFLFRGLPMTPRGPVTISLSAGEAT